LNLDLGDRYSSYSAFGTTNNGKVAIEYRPIKDLLLRGSVSDVFRAPEIGNVFGGATNNSPTLTTDLCAGTYNLAQLQALFSAHSGACGASTGTNVAGLIAAATPPPNYKGPPITVTIPSTIRAGQTTGILEGSDLGGVQLSPEKGHSYDFGFVYDPQFVPGLSTTLDYYRVTLTDEITNVAPSTSMSTCFANNSSPLCNFIQRLPNGGIAQFLEPTFNIGSLATDGFDASIKYRENLNQWGAMTYSVDVTHIDSFVEDTDPAASDSNQYAGTFEPAHGNLAKWRGNANIGWSKGDLNIGWTTRWVGRLNVSACNPTATAPGCIPAGLVPGAAGGPLNIGNYFDNSVTAGYNIKAYNSRVDIGVDNVFNKAPPEFYQFGLNNNTDVNTYDTIGRLFWGRFTVKF
jgi:iron complex outermembrane receptor protein